ncbi:ABC transporter ATP-binding protein [Paracidobacterium acidisoli]|nr:ABC transporter ATP-binding protein [Paracidobacterium acidisoli]
MGQGATKESKPLLSVNAAGKRKLRVQKVLPELWALLRPHHKLIYLGIFLLLVDKLSGLVLPLSTKVLIDNVIGKHNGYLLAPLIGALLLATILQAICSFVLSQALSKAAWSLITDLRIQVQEHIGKLPVAFYDANRTGALVSRIMTDVEGLRNLMGAGMVEFCGGILTAVMAFGVLMWISAKLTLLIFVIMAVFILTLRKVFGAIRPIYHERRIIYAEITGRLTESLGGVRVVKSYHAEDREAGVFAAGARRLLANLMKAITAISFMSMSTSLVIGIVGSLVMFVGAREILGHKITLGSYVTYTVFLAYLLAPAFQLSSIGTQLTEAIAGLDRTYEVLAEDQEDSDPRRTVKLPKKPNGEVVFDNVDFAYETDKPVLNGISFVANPGTVTALVGPSGSGKSTIINLISAFHISEQGKITVDGVDINTVDLGSYRIHLGVVLQESFLFDGTIRENIAFSRPAATEEEIMEAARIARVDEFAYRFPDGFNTIIGERGVKLSGGQRQRISIARAILADPGILILDEATSSLDSESEAFIQEGLSWLMKGRTTFVIAHRLSTIRKADQILFLETGRIMERGTHAELIEAKGRYYDLYTKQYALESNLFLAPGEGEASEPEETAVAGKTGDISFRQALRGLR